MSKIISLPSKSFQAWGTFKDRNSYPQSLIRFFPSHIHLYNSRSKQKCKRPLKFTVNIHLKEKQNTSSMLSRYLTTPDRNKTVYWQIYNFNNNLVFKRLYFFVRYALKVIEFKLNILILNICKLPMRQFWPYYYQF